MSISNPRLPPELECQIFEIAARSCREELEPGLNLQLVARRVHVWAERIFMEAVVLRDAAHAENFLQLVHSKPAGFFADIVHALVLPYAIGAENARKVLSVCTGVRVFVYCVDYQGTTPELSLQISHLPLLRLQIEAHLLLSIPLATCAWLSTLTDLELIFLEDLNDSIQLLALFRQLPQLTHVHLDRPNTLEWSLDLAKKLCSSCPRLRAVCLDVAESGKGVDEDPRIVWNQPPHYSNVQDWVRSLP
ncbi:hypothetical protein C8J57DRAFT_338168 [Mycena rebaudengoi]|nr:hypothetical protein C8J57DRAFT_338168 [Mycena rebaudengoi]